MEKTELIAHLKRLGACSDWVEWLEGSQSGETVADVYDLASETEIAWLVAAIDRVNLKTLITLLLNPNYYDLTNEKQKEIFHTIVNSKNHFEILDYIRSYNASINWYVYYNLLKAMEEDLGVSNHMYAFVNILPRSARNVVKAEYPLARLLELLPNS